MVRGLKRINGRIEEVDQMVHQLMEEVNSTTIQESFNDNVHIEVINLQTVYGEWINGRTPATERSFVRQCERTNAMKTILTSLHHNLVHHKTNNYNELFSGGVI